MVSKLANSFLLNNVSKYIMLIVCLIALSIQAKSSNPVSDSQENKIAQLKATAAKYDKSNDVYNAITYYTQYLSYKNKDVKISWRLATLLLETRDYANACQYYDSVILRKPKKYPLAYYYKGMVCMNLQKYDEAIEAFALFRKVYHENDAFNYRRLAVIYSANCVWAKDHKADNGDVEISHPGVSLNHSNIDFSPFPVDENTLLYGAVYSNSLQNISSIRQLFKAIKTNGQWKSVGLLDTVINNPEYNTGNAVISNNGQRLYFTRSRKNWQGVEISEIYVSKLDGESWTIPEKLPYPVNDENYTSTQPTLGKNEKTGNEILYFTSNRKGGKGGLDIWYTEFDKKTNHYKEPQDLGKDVNSIGDECCPFYDIASRTLYFSSNGKANGLGGFDIYKANGSTKKWTDAQSLPVPYNSSFDEYYFTILKNNKEGFFTSNRPGAFTTGNGSCCDDIFAFKINDCVRISSHGTVRIADNYDVYNNLNEKYHLGIQLPEKNMMLPHVPIELYLTDDKESNDIFISKTTTDSQGSYRFDLERNKHYKIVVKNYGYLEKSLHINTLGADCSDTISVETAYINYLPKVNARVNIYYDSDKDKLTSAAESTIDSMLMPLFKLFPNAIIEIGSYTDNNGSEQYNLNLSQRRSESVVNYLIAKGIQNERLVPKGYGMGSPIAPNTNADGSNNSEGQQLNRRTEIKIVGEISNFNLNE